MGRKVYEGQYKSYWLTACSNIAAPTTAEIAAGTYIGSLLTKDGVAFNFSENSVDTAALDDTFDTMIGGSWGIKPLLTFMRDGTSETAGYDLVVKGTNGFLLISYFGTPASSSKCAVIPSQMGVPQLGNTAANEVQKFTANFFATATPNLKAVVA